jgi:hypothetical protein
MTQAKIPASIFSFLRIPVMLRRTAQVSLAYRSLRCLGRRFRRREMEKIKNMREMRSEN